MAYYSVQFDTVEIRMPKVLPICIKKEERWLVYTVWYYLYVICIKIDVKNQIAQSGLYKTDSFLRWSIINIETIRKLKALALFLCSDDFIIHFNCAGSIIMQVSIDGSNILKCLLHYLASCSIMHLLAFVTTCGGSRKKVKRIYLVCQSSFVCSSTWRWKIAVTFSATNALSWPKRENNHDGLQIDSKAPAPAAPYQHQQ